jgi:glucose-1-phosphate cytidylyltransferase
VDVSDDGKVLDFQEKPVLDKWINIGYFYFKNEMKEKINKFDKFEVFLKDLANQKILNVYKHSGLHITINTLKELADAEKSIVEIEGKRK